MNKNRIWIAAALALSLPWVGCNKSGKLDQPSTFKPPAGPVELKLKWPQGERVVQDMDMKMKMEMSMPGQPGPMKQDMTMGQEYGLTVLKENPDGGHELEMEFLSVRMKMAMGTKTMMEYDSAKKSSADKPDPEAGILGKIVGCKIRYFLNASNEVERLEGIDAMMDRLGAGEKAQALAPVKSMFSEGYFKQMMSQNRFLPPKPVQVGDTWPVQFDVPMGAMGAMVMNFTFTLKGWEMHGKRNCARLDFQGTITSKPDSTPNPAGVSISSLDGTSSGTSWFDPELGIIIDTAMNQDVNMVMNLPAKPRGNQGGAPRMQTITNQMNQSMTLKMVSVN
jgi:hypothetical protein